MRSPSILCCALVLAWIGSLSVARAQTAPLQDSAKDSTTPADKSPVAPPSPEAPPQKVNDAKNAAKAAALAPILPSPKNPLHPAFQLYAEIDLPILGVGVVFVGARLVHLQPAYCSPLCDRGGLNAIDRTTAGYWSPRWQTASDYGLYGIGVAAAVLLLADEGFLPALNDGAVVAESALAATSVATVMTLAAGRPRPFLYGEKAPLSARQGADAGLSFLSSHASVSFAIATSTVVTMRRLHPRTKTALIVAGVGGAAASFVAIARVFGGMHFISDAAGGAVVGTSVGVLVSSMHGSPVAIVPVAGEGQRGIALSARF